MPSLICWGLTCYHSLKAVANQKLYYTGDDKPGDYPNLEPVLNRAINWELIIQQYDEMIKYAIVLKQGTAEPEAILRRFTKNNVQHPTWGSDRVAVISVSFPPPPSRTNKHLCNLSCPNHQRCVHSIKNSYDNGLPSGTSSPKDIITCQFLPTDKVDIYSIIGLFGIHKTNYCMKTSYF
ncbi:Tn3 family transposase [Salmonella enterica]|nr:Tn3 family transposase [Salmonella enterica]ELH4156655.1 Tn3 family transposase [Salmonella enterica]